MSLFFLKKAAPAIFILAMVAGALMFFQISRKSSSMQSIHRIAIEQFFKKIVIHDDFGYTLFGSKPVSITGYFDPIPSENWDMTRPNNIIKDGWAALKNYLPQGGLRNYLLEESNLYPDLKILTLINKRSFVETVDKHRHIFEKVLKREVTGKKLIEQLECDEGELFDLLDRHEGLYGIVLGYGVENAFLFQRRMDLNIYNPNPSFSLSKAVCGKGFKSLEEEMCFLKDLWVVCEEEKLCPVVLPVFLGIKDSEESRALIKQYREVRKELTQIIYSDHFIEKILLQLGCKVTH